MKTRTAIPLLFCLFATALLVVCVFGEDDVDKQWEEEQRKAFETQLRVRKEQKRLEEEKNKLTQQAVEAEERVRKAATLAAQPERAALAEKLFTSVGLIPPYCILGKRGKDKGWSLELVGKGWPELVKLYEAKDWAGLVWAMGEGTPDGLLPDEKTIRRAVITFKERPRQILIRGFESSGLNLPYWWWDIVTIISAREQSGFYDYVKQVRDDNSSLRGAFTRHPDGIGLIVNPTAGDFNVSYNDVDENRKLLLFSPIKEGGCEDLKLRDLLKSQGVIEQWNEAIQRLNAKLQLEEIDKGEYRQQCNEVSEKLMKQQLDQILRMEGIDENGYYERLQQYRGMKKETPMQQRRRELLERRDRW
jgi:hypothetical protein